MDMNRYILVNKKPVVEKDIHKWGAFFSREERIVAKTSKNDIIVSTVFLGLDHNFEGTGGPILFETLVFGGKFDGEMHRYRTWDEAVKGHDQMVRKVFGNVEKSRHRVLLGD